jgi:carbonic anhydrase
MSAALMKDSNNMKKSLIQKLAVVCAAVVLLPGYLGADAPSTVNADEALKLLKEGNERFTSGKLNSVTPEELTQRRGELATGQKPFAVLVCCSDSRVGPEIVFDQELGNIFVVRTAGQVLDAAGIGSIEYAVAHLGSPLIMVLGHESCGAVAAAVADAKEPGHIGDVIKAIRPAVEKAKDMKGNELNNAIEVNVQDIVARLKKTGPIISEKVKSGQVKIVGGVLSLKSGNVMMVPEK